MNAPFRFLQDSLMNLMSGLGVNGRDKSTAGIHYVRELTDAELIAAYRADWIARKCVDIPANDATREWRAWQAENEQIEAIEKEEAKFNLVQKVFDAMSYGRLFGGAVMILGVEDGVSSDKPINVDNVKQGGLKFIHVVPKTDITCGELITDLLDPWYGYPKYFTRKEEAGVVRDVIKIHPSRVIIFKGNKRPDFFQQQNMWGDSVLISVDDAIRNAASVTGSIAALVHEAKIDVIHVPGLSEIVQTQKGKDDLTARFQYANTAKSIINTLLLDEKETWERITVNFAGMPELMQMYLMISAGAVDIPATRFLSQDPKGLNATGDSDIRNYYDRVKAEQRLILSPALTVLDDVLLLHTFGTRDPKIFYNWNPLWQMTDTEKADLAKKKADTAKIDSDMGLIPPTALAKARQNQLIEDGVYPGLEKALAEAEAAGDIAAALQEPPPDAGGQLGPDGNPINSGDPKALPSPNNRNPKKPTRHATLVIKADGSRGFIDFDPDGGHGDARGGSQTSGARGKSLTEWIWDLNPYHEPAGTDRGGQFASAGTSGGAATKKFRSKSKAVDFQFDMRMGTPTAGRQSVSSLDELYVKCFKAEPEFKATIEAIASETGGTSKFAHGEEGTTLKKRASAERKMRDELDGDASQLRDILRATIVHDTVLASRKACAEFINAQGGKILRVKDRFVEPIGGYRDLLVNFVTAEGLTAEVQFNSKSLLDAKHGSGHALYEKARLLPSTGFSQHIVDKYRNDAVGTYEEAYKKDGNGSWKKRNA